MNDEYDMPWCDTLRAMAGTLNFSKYKTSQHILYLYLICFLVITKSINKTIFKLEFWVISRPSKGLKIYWAYMFWFLLSYWDEYPKGLKTKSTREHSLKALFIKELSPSIIQSDNNREFIEEIEQRFCKEPGVGNVHLRLHHPHQKVRDKILMNWSIDLCQGFHKSCSEFSKLMSGLCYSQLLNACQIYKNYKPSPHDSLRVESIIMVAFKNTNFHQKILLILR